MGAIANAVHNATGIIPYGWADYVIDDFVAELEDKGIHVRGEVHWQMDYGRCDVTFDCNLKVPTFIKEHEAQLPLAWVMLLGANDDYAECGTRTTGRSRTMYATCELYDMVTVGEGFFAGASMDELRSNGTLDIADMEEAILTICDNYAHDFGETLSATCETEEAFARFAQIEVQINKHRDTLKIILRRIKECKRNLLDEYWKVLDGLDTDIDLDDLLALELVESKYIGTLTTAGLNLIQEI